MKSFFLNPSTRAMEMGRDLFGLKKNGDEFPIEIGLNPIKIENDYLVIASIIDITERKMQEHGFQLIVESMPNALILSDKNGKIMMANQKMVELFGYTKDELYQNSIENLIPKRYTKHHPENMKSFFLNPSIKAMGTGRDLFVLKKIGD